jgi:Mn2+/Fe2+ NRAMP family transporter
MISLVALTIGLVAWIFFWATGMKPFDAFLIMLVIFLPAAAVQVFGPGIKKMMGQTPPPE